MNAIDAATRRYHTDAEFHARVYQAVELVVREVEQRSGPTRSRGVATMSAAVALHLASACTEGDDVPTSTFRECGGVSVEVGR